MANTVAEIREWHGEGRPFHVSVGGEMIGTLLAAIERFEARLKLAEAVCKAVGRHKANDGQSLGEIFAAHDAYLAGQKD